MKRVFLLTAAVVIMLSTSLSAFANVEYRCVAPYDLSSRAVGVVNTVTGVNYVSKKAAEQILKKQVTKNAEGKFKVRIDSYGVTDLMSGRFKGFEVLGEDVIADGVYITRVDVKTLCGFNYVEYDQKTSMPIFREDLPMSFGLVFTEADLNRTMRASGYEDMISRVNSIGKALSIFEVESTGVKIKNDKFYYVINARLPIMGISSDRTYSLVLLTDLRVENGKIKLSRPEIVNEVMRLDLSKLTRAINYLNPLEYSMRIMQDKDAVVKVKSVNISNNEINVNGIINIPKDELTQR